MNVQPSQRMDKAAFLAWIEAKEERCELARGCVVIMPRPTRAHALIKGNLAMTALRSRLDRLQWEVLMAFGLDAGPDTFRYPDVVVDRAGGNNKDYAATAPVLLAEVLSPENAEIDLGDKVAEYLQIPSLLAYIVLSQDEPKAWVFERTGSQFASGPAVVSGADAAIRIAALQLELPMAEIYAGIKTD
jgi:Uma2 family endonuclease